jgi:anti-sigma B factor antagonist
VSTAFILSEESFGPERHVIAVGGELDLFTSPKLKQQLADALESGKLQLVVDLSETTFVDSSALGTLIGALRRARERGGRLLLVSQGPEIARTMELTGLDQVFDIHATRAEALAELDRPAA